MFCTKIKSSIKTLLRKFDNYVDAHIETALKLTSALKDIIASPVGDIVTVIIPGDLDNRIRMQLIDALDKSIASLSIIESCKQQTELNEKLKCFVAQLQEHEPHLQEAILHKLASLVAGHLDGARLEQNLYDLYTQAKYSAGKN